MLTRKLDTLEEFLDSLYLRYSSVPQATFDPGQLRFDDHFDQKRFVSDPLVTVKVMTYDHDKLLSRALDHILQQSVDFPYEIIVSDDCSPDNTQEIAKRYLQEFPEKIRYTRTHRNETGRVNGRIGEFLARGKYIAICEGDDYWHDPEKLQLQVGVLEKNSDWIVVHSSVSNARGHDEDREITRRRRANMAPGPESGVTVPYLHRTYTIHNCSSMYRRDSLLQAIRETRALIDSTQFIHGDVPRFLGLSRLGAFYFLDRELATYQVNEESSSQSSDLRRRIAIRMSSTMIRVWYARLYLQDEPLANSLLEDLLLWLYYSNSKAASIWGQNKLDEIGHAPSLVHRLARPWSQLQRAVRRRRNKKSS